MVRGAPLAWFSGLAAGSAWGCVGSRVRSRPRLTPLSESLTLSGLGLFDPKALKALLACGLCLQNQCRRS